MSEVSKAVGWGVRCKGDGPLLMLRMVEATVGCVGICAHARQQSRELKARCLLERGGREADVPAPWWFMDGLEACGVRGGVKSRCHTVERPRDSYTYVHRLIVPACHAL